MNARHEILLINPHYLVNMCKRGGTDGVFQGLTGLLKGILEGAALQAQGMPQPSHLFYTDFQKKFYFAK